MKKIFSLIIVIIICSCNKKEKFNLCGIGLKYPYYYSNCHYIGGKYQIKKDLLKLYHSGSYSENSTGIIQFKFVINCKGEIGDLKLIQFSKDYELTQLNVNMIADLSIAFKEIDSWVVGTDNNGGKVNSFVFISIILENGEIIEILPK